MMEKQANVIGRTIVPFLVMLKFGASFEKVHLRLSLIFYSHLCQESRSQDVNFMNVSSFFLAALFPAVVWYQWVWH